MARLEILDGKSKGEVVELTEGEALEIGTKRKAGLRLRDPGVSYNHAAVTLKGGVLVVEDRKSKAGTFYGDARLDKDPVDVADGETFRCGDTSIRFIAVEPEPEVEEVPAETGPAPTASDGGAEAAELKSKLEKVETERRTLSFEKDSLLKELEQTREQLAEAEDIASDGVEQANELEERCAELTERCQALESRLEAVTSLETEVKELRNETTLLRQEAASAKTRVSQTEEQLVTSEAARLHAEEMLAESKREFEDRIAKLETALREARREARRAARRATAMSRVRDDRDGGIAGSAEETAIRDGALAAFDPENGWSGNGAADDEGESLAAIQERVQATATEIEDIKANGVRVKLSAEDLEQTLREREQELAQLRDELEQKCEEVEELNEEYQQTLEELEKARG